MMNILVALILASSPGCALALSFYGPKPAMVSRRDSLRAWVPVALGGLSVLSTREEPVIAAELPSIEVHEGFDLVRSEIESGGIATLDAMIEAEEWEKILEFTKLYDLSFRKLSMKRVVDALVDEKANKKVVTTCFITHGLVV